MQGAQGLANSMADQNMLGKLLEQVRASCLSETELDDWIRISAVKLMSTAKPSDIPTVRLDVLKEGH